VRHLKIKSQRNTLKDAYDDHIAFAKFFTKHASEIAQRRIS